LLEAFICVTCGTQFPPAGQPPAECPICLDSRQFVGLDGQQWTNLRSLQQTHKNTLQPEEPGLHSILTQPGFAIGERAFLLETPAGNILWDCITLLDPSTIDAVQALGGIAAIAISHPHYYSSMVEWSVEFGNVPVWLHEADRQWVMRPHANLHFWSGASAKVIGDLTLIHTPGHFAGYQVLHWPGGAYGKGALLSGDQPQVCLDTRWVSFMYSYPNYIPLGRRAIEGIVDRLSPYSFDRIYGAFPKRTVMTDAKAVIERSARRYFDAIKPA
jgi:hypothetical protein